MILPPLPPKKTKKTKKEKPATTITRSRKNVVVSDSEPDDRDMPDAAAEIGKSKKRNMTLKTDYTVASSNDANPEEVHNAITNSVPKALTCLQYSEEVLKAADVLLGFLRADDTPMSASSATSCSTNSGLAAVLDATGTIERQPNPSPRQQKPSASFAPHPAARFYKLNKQYPRQEHPPLMPKGEHDGADMYESGSASTLVPEERHNGVDMYEYGSASTLLPEEEHNDVDTYDYGSASSFTPINVRKETARRKNRGLIPGIESSKSLAKAAKQTPKSPTDRFIHHARPERPRAAMNVDRDARRMKIPENRFEEIDSDVEITGARRLRDAEPNFGNGNGHADSCEFETIKQHVDQS